MKMGLFGASYLMVVIYYGWNLFGLSEASFKSYPLGTEKHNVCVLDSGAVEPATSDTCKANFCTEYSEMQLSPELAGGAKVGVCKRRESLETAKLVSGNQSSGDFDEESPFAQTQTFVSYLFRHDPKPVTIVRSQAELSRLLDGKLNESTLSEYLSRFHKYRIHTSRTVVSKQADGSFLVKDLFRGSDNCGYWSSQATVSSGGVVSEIRGSVKQEQEGAVTDC